MGVRPFAPRICGYDYEMRGQQLYLGSISIGAELGGDVDWGSGFLTPITEDEWIDINVQ